jgi:hypothetical protein
MSISRAFKCVGGGALLAAATLVMACREPTGTALQPQLVAGVPSDTGAIGADTTPQDSLAHAFALALADSALRTRLLDDLRDSPFHQHAVYLSTYLSGQSGQTIAKAAANAIGVVPQRLVAIAEQLHLQVSMPRMLDRMSWKGSGSVVVYASAKSPHDLFAADRPLIGHTVRGARLYVPLHTAVTYPVIAMLPASQEFGSAPEAARSAAPNRPGSTISTREEEIEAMTVVGFRSPTGNTRLGPGTVKPLICTCEDTSCTPRPPGCDTPPQPTGAVVPDFANFNACWIGLPNGTFPPNAADKDNDGLKDQCEYELAYAFRPFMAFSSTDIDASRETYYSVKVKSVTSKTVEIFYAIGYHEDDGESGPVCQGCSAHQGDSEWIIVEADGTTGWVLTFATLSAHWNEPVVDGTTRYSSGHFAYPENFRARPEVWVAEDKHANYNTDDACDSGAEFTDNCDRNSLSTKWGNTLTNISPGTNIGQDGGVIFVNFGGRSNRLVDCIASVTTLNPTQPYYPGTECFWSGTTFRGWLAPPVGDGSTPYATALRAFGFNTTAASSTDVVVAF